MHRLQTQRSGSEGAGRRGNTLKTLWLSLDPYMRGRMSAAKYYAKPVEPGEVMVGGTVSEVVASNNKLFKPGRSSFY